MIKNIKNHYSIFIVLAFLIIVLVVSIFGSSFGIRQYFEYKYFTAIIITIFILLMCVLIHFEALNILTVMLPDLHLKSRYRIIYLMIGLLLAHTIEIFIFASGYLFMTTSSGFGYLKGEFSNSILDLVYFSMQDYTSLGLGDIEPIGSIRILAGMESLAGLLLIGWSVSFTFIEMQRFWKQK
jgi:hypothetical protein